MPWNTLRWLLSTAFAICLALLARPAAAQSPSAAAVRIGPAPTWVERFDDSMLHEAPPSGGVSTLLVSVFARHVGKEHVRFVRGAVRAENELGIGAVARRTFEFVPPHQQLVIHRLEIHRSNTVVSHLHAGAIEVIRREPGLENDVYDGVRTAIAVLPDIRVGDVVVYEYSTIGANPVFAGHWAETWPLAGDHAIGSLQLGLTTDRAVHTALFAGAQAPTLTERGGLHVVSYRLDGGPALDVSEEYVPPELRLVPTIELSDTGDWSEVAAWAEPMFRTGKPGERVAAAAREAMSATVTTEHAIVAALRKVQDDVRYVSLAFAESTHRPSQPESVLARRFGDCKDKSLLLVSVLRAMGLEAYVALVRSRGGARLADELPAIDAFDHAIVAVEHQGRLLFLDPTRVRQRGRLSDVAARHVRQALVLAPGARALTAVVDEPDERPQISSSLHYVIKEMGGASKLEVATTFTGLYADMYRVQFASQTPSEFSEDVARPLLAVHPRAVRMGNAKVVDWPNANELVVSVELSLDGAWGSDQTHEQVLETFPPFLRGIIPTLKPERKNPLLLEYPLRIVHDVSIDVRGVIEVRDVQSREEKVSFTLVHSVSSGIHETSTHIDLHSDLAIRTRRLEPDQFEAHRQALHEVEGLSFVLSLSKPAPPPGMPWAIYVTTSAWCVAVAALLFFVDRRKLHLSLSHVAYDPALAGRTGWLALLALPVNVGPALAVWNAVEFARYFSPSQWRGISEDPTASPSILVFELFALFAIALVALYTSFAYWRRRRTFPLMFAALQTLAVTYTVLDRALVAAAAGAPDATSSALLTAPFRTLAAAVWVVYVLRSKRVRATFVPPLETPPRRRKAKKPTAPATSDEVF